MRATAAATRSVSSVPCAIGSRRASASSAAARLDLEHVERCLRERGRNAVRICVTAEAEPDLADAGRAGPLRVQRRTERIDIADDPRAVDAGEALDRRRDPDANPRAADLERQQPVRSRRPREAWCREHGYGLRVGELPGTYAG